MLKVPCKGADEKDVERNVNEAPDENDSTKAGIEAAREESNAAEEPTLSTEKQPPTKRLIFPRNASAAINNESAVIRENLLKFAASLLNPTHLNNGKRDFSAFEKTLLLDKAEIMAKKPLKRE